ncbi:MAG: hypothetical protein HN380_29835 [Victivallales bacterium]|nr:hypothetical protein [Victivallales bacterium]
MQVLCEKCGAAIAVDNVDLKRGLAKCVPCAALFDCSRQLDGMAGGDKPMARERGEVAKPKNAEVFYEGGAMRIVRKDTMSTTGFIVLGGGAVAGILVVLVCAVALLAGDRRAGDLVGVALGAGIVGLMFGYCTLVALLNSTTITVSGGLLHVTSGPVPVACDKRIVARMLKQLYVKSEAVQSRVFYALYAATTDGRDVKLLSGLSTQDEVHFLEQEIEKFLGIEDRPVSGETVR